MNQAPNHEDRPAPQTESAAPAPSADAAPPRGSARWRWTLAFWGLVVAAAAIRLLRVGAREAWLDEACTSLFAQSGGPGPLLELLGPESHPPLYYLFMQAWTALFGASEVALRVPSLLFGVALVALVWRAVRRYGGGRYAAALGAGLAAGSPLLVYYSVEAKGYTLLWALALGVVLTLERATEPGHRRAFWAAGLLTVAALYTHHYAIFLLPLWPVAVWGAPKGARLLGALVGGLALALYLPWAIGFLASQTAAGGTDWLASYWQGPLPALFESARAMALAPPFPGYLGELGSVDMPLIGAALVGLVFTAPTVMGIVTTPRRHKAAGLRGRRPISRSALLFLLLLLPTVGAAVVSIWRPIFLPGRYELMAYPAWIVLWALGLDWLEKGFMRCRTLRLQRVCAATLTLVGLAAPALPYLTRPADPWPHRDAARQLQKADEHDAIVTIGLTRAPLEHQLRLLGDGHELRSFPSDVATHVGWWNPSAYNDQTLREDAAATVRGLAEHPGVWLVVPLGPRGRPLAPRATQAAFDALRRAGRRPAQPTVFANLGLTRFESDRPALAAPTGATLGPLYDHYRQAHQHEKGRIVEKMRMVAHDQIFLEVNGKRHQAVSVFLCPMTAGITGWRCQPGLSREADDTIHTRRVVRSPALEVPENAQVRLVDHHGVALSQTPRIGLGTPAHLLAHGYREIAHPRMTPDGRLSRLELPARAASDEPDEAFLFTLTRDPETKLFLKHVWIVKRP